MWLGENYELQGLFSEAIPHYEKAFELNDSPYGLGNLGHAYARSGRVDEAHAVLERLEELSKSRYVAPLERAYVYAGLGDLDNCFEWLEKAYDERTSILILARVLTIANDIGHDPRFADLTRRVGLEGLLRRTNLVARSFGRATCDRAPNSGRAPTFSEVAQRLPRGVPRSRATAHSSN